MLHISFFVTQSITKPPSMTKFCPVAALPHGEAKNKIASATSLGSVTFFNGVDCLIISNTSGVVALLAN